MVSQETAWFSVLFNQLDNFLVKKETSAYYPRILFIVCTVYFITCTRFANRQTWEVFYSELARHLFNFFCVASTYEIHHLLNLNWYFERHFCKILKNPFKWSVQIGEESITHCMICKPLKIKICFPSNLLLSFYNRYCLSMIKLARETLWELAMLLTLRFSMYLCLEWTFFEIKSVKEEIKSISSTIWHHKRAITFSYF